MGSPSGISDKVETHFSNGTAVFNVVIVQLNGEVQVSERAERGENGGH